MIKVSVVVPVYNAEKYLRQCLDSIVNQTLKDIEIIIIDDGSTDNSAEICKEYLKDPRVKYFYKENAGAVMARRDGINCASGEYIGFIDSDDWVESNMYETMYQVAKKEQADIVFCNCVRNENDYYFSPEMESGVYNRVDIENKIIPKTLAYITNKGERRAIRWSNCLRIYKKELIHNRINYNPEIRRCEDLVLNYEATLNSNVYVYVGDQYLYHNRVVQNSKSRRYTKDAWSAFRNLILHLYNDTNNADLPGLMQQMHLRAFFSVIDCLENELKFYKKHKKHAIKEIKRIMSDEINDRYYSYIPIEKMSKRYRVYYKLIHQKRPRALVFYENLRIIDNDIQIKIIRPIINFITEGKFTGRIYKFLRRKS